MIIYVFMFFYTNHYRYNINICFNMQQAPYFKIYHKGALILATDFRYLHFFFKLLTINVL